AYRYFQRTRPKHRKRIKALDKVIAKQALIAPDGERLIITGIKSAPLPSLPVIKKSFPQIKQSKVQRVRGIIQIHSSNRIKMHHRNGE
ncbi:hypothetical protein, partial [Enterobacter hormaechei]